MTTSPESFPRTLARTRRFSLGRPRTFSAGADGRAVVFLRSRGPVDPQTCLYLLSTTPWSLRLVIDPVALDASTRSAAGVGPGETSEEQARRERARETAQGVLTYGLDRQARVAATSLAGRLVVADLYSGALTFPAAAGAVHDPRPDPTGTRVAYLSGRALRVLTLADGTDRVLAEDEDPQVSWGLAEFVAAEEMDRARGYWWSPDGTALLAARVDTRPVQRWWIADPAAPDREPTPIFYPAAGTPNADVQLAVLGLDGSRLPVGWDTRAFPYLVHADWPPGRGPVLVVLSRDQRHLQLLEVDQATGTTHTLHEEHDAAWLEVPAGVPAWLPDGRLVWLADRDGAGRVLVAGVPVTPGDLQVERVVHVGHAIVLVATGAGPADRQVLLVSAAGALTPLSSGPGLHAAVAGGDLVVISSATLDEFGTTTRVWRVPALVGAAGEPVELGTVESLAATPPFAPRVALLRSGRRELATALVLPRSWTGGSLPVLMDPYGGPHAQRVLHARAAYLESQWLADQGFAVIVADGRGTPGRGPGWAREVLGDLATPALEDQVDALHAVAAAHPGLLDLDRVAIRGWSFGGYLAALAVLRRPDVFHAAIAGAPVTDWALYDTFYTERYLGDPAVDRGPYERSSLLSGAGLAAGAAAGPHRPLLIVHGLADDNVVVAHSLRLSAALFAAGRWHAVLPLPGVTHMTPAVEERLLELQVDFLHRSLLRSSAAR